MPEILGAIEYNYKWTLSPDPPRVFRNKPAWEYVRWEVGNFGEVFHLWRRPKN